MTASRRKFLTALTGTGITVGLAGCTSLQNTELSASPAKFSEDALSGTSYQYSTKRTVETQQLLENIASVDADVSADSYIVGYTHKTQLQGAAVISTPSISLGDRELNPLTQDIETVIGYAVQFTNTQSEQTQVTIQDYTLQEELQLETPLGSATGYRYELTAQSQEFGKITFDALLTVLTNESSVILTGGGVLKEIENTPEELASAVGSTETNFESLIRLVEGIQHPVEWSNVETESS